MQIDQGDLVTLEEYFPCPVEDIEQLHPEELGQDLQGFDTLKQAEDEAIRRGWGFIYHQVYLDDSYEPVFERIILIGDYHVN